MKGEKEKPLTGEEIKWFREFKKERDNEGLDFISRSLAIRKEFIAFKRSLSKFGGGVGHTS